VTAESKRIFEVSESRVDPAERDGEEPEETVDRQWEEDVAS
jgi:hypothetical protein